MTLRERIRLALREDAPRGDPTSAAVLPPGGRASAEIRAKATGIVAGLAAARAALLAAGRGVRVRLLARDGDPVRPGTAIARVEGPARAILKGERLALDLLCHLSGVATLARAYAEAVRGTGAAVRHTRKTTPLWRDLEIAAVLAGGGSPHRRSLSDGVLVKDNHLALLGDPARLAGAIRRWRQRGLEPMVEVTDERQARAALAAGARSLLVDNASPARIRRIARIARRGPFGRVFLEASGGITLENARRIARTGVDAISVGRLTHSAPALDFSLEILPA